MTTLGLSGPSERSGNAAQATKTSRTVRTIITGLGLGSLPQPKPDYRSLSKAAYERNVIIYSLVGKIARAAGTVPWTLMERPGRGAKTVSRTRRLVSERFARKAMLYSGHNAFKVKAQLEQSEVVDSPLLDLIERPNPEMSQHQYFEWLLSFMLLSGNGYEEFVTLESSQDKTPKEMWPLRPDRVEIIPNSAVRAGEFELRDGTTLQFNAVERQQAAQNDGLVYRYDYRVGASTQKFGPQSMIHHKFFHPTDDFYGLSPLLVGARAWQTDNMANDWNFALLKNEGRPSGAMVIPEVVQDDTYNRMKNQIDEMMAGDPGRPLLLEGGMEWQQFGLSPIDMDWTGGKDQLLLTLCALYNTPPEIAGSSDHRTYNSMPEARKAWWQDAILPLLVSIRDTYNLRLAPLYGEQFVLDFDRDQIEALQEDRNALWSRMKAADHVSIQEKREATGYEPAESDDEDVSALLDVPTQLLTLGATTTQVDQGAPPPEPTPFARGNFSASKKDEDGIDIKAQSLSPRQQRLRNRMRKTIGSYYRALGRKLSRHVAAEVKR